MQTQDIAVVIPFFQRSPGILLRALTGVFAQTRTPALILIVDDASPISAESELATVDPTWLNRIQVITQANAGPAGARNKALDNLPENIEYVAFLDSDDVWREDHLERAMSALEQGFDFYFADFYQLEAKETAFKRAGRIQSQDHRPLQGEELYAYQGDLFDQTLRANVIGTPTVCYHYRKFATLRFRDDLVFAGEDYLFWMTLARARARVAFSTRCACDCGRGVNVYSGSGWGTEHSMIRTCHELGFGFVLPRIFELNDSQRDFLRTRRDRLETYLVRDILFRMVRFKPIQVGELFRLFSMDGAMPFRLFKALFKVITKQS